MRGNHQNEEKRRFLPELPGTDSLIMMASGAGAEFEAVLGSFFFSKFNFQRIRCCNFF